MRVRCIGNRGAHLVAPYVAADSKPLDEVFGITIGELYTVYALGLGERGIYYYIADDNFHDSPRYYAGCLFELEHPSVSRYWLLALARKDSDHRNMLAPPEWLEEPWFFNRVVDGEQRAVETFMEMKSRLDAEASQRPC